MIRHLDHENPEIGQGRTALVLLSQRRTWHMPIFRH
jgi:hypothetical protein